MQKILPRITAITLLVLTFSVFTYSAPAPLRLKVATAGSAESVEAKGLYYFKELVEERTEGKVLIDVYTNGVLGDEQQLTEGLQMGTVDAIITSSFKYAAFVPEMELLNLPFLFTGEEHWRVTMFGPVGEKFVDCVYQRRGDMLLGFMTSGPRNIFSRKEIIGWSGLKGLKIRVSTVSSELSVWKALGVKPRAIARYDLTAALQTGLVDAAENNFITIKQMKFYEPPSQYILRTEHQITPLLFLLGSSSYRKIPEKLRTTIVSCGGEAALWQVDESFAENKIVERELVNKYWVRITELTPEEKKVWREKVGDAHQKVADRLGLGELLEVLNSLIPVPETPENNTTGNQG